MEIKVKRGESQLLVDFKQTGMEICGTRRGNVELQLVVDLFPLEFYLSLKAAVENGRSAHPRINLPFGKKHDFYLERQGGLKNDEVWFTLKSTTDGFFAIELRESEIRILLAEMKRLMTR